MNIESIIKLHEIGVLLDQRKFERLRIHNSGIVEAGKIAATVSTQAEEQDHEQQRPRRPETESWAWAQTWERPTDRPWSSCASSQDVSANLKVTYEAGLGEAYKAYPNCQVWKQKEGMFLLTESSLLTSIRKKAKFFTWLPFIHTLPVRSWGFWNGNQHIPPKWIGPRHTNYDGSVCAFEPRDETWVAGNRIVNLLDLYTLWAVRHLHLEVFGRWPGDQIARDHYERLRELKGDEFCGCGKTDKRYSDCCYINDLNAAKNGDTFISVVAKGEQRTPPKEVQNFILGCGDIPRHEELNISIFKKYIANNPGFSPFLRLF